MQTKKTKRPKGLIRRFIPYFAKYKAVLFFDLFCAALTTVCELVLPMLVRYVTNAGINDLASLTVGVVLKIGALYLFLRLVDAAANFFMASVGHIMGTKIETDMRTAMFDHLQKLSFNYFDNTKVAQIMTRITTDLFDVTEFAHHCPEEFFIAGGKTEAMEALREVRRLSKALLVFKLGDKGCAALPGDIPDSFVDEVVYPGFPVKVFNSIGAGDGFMSGFLRGWLRNEDLASCCRYANAAGAFAVSRLGCSSAYPSWTELQYFVSHGSKHKWLREDAMLEQIHWATNRRNKWKNLAVFAFDHRDPFSALAAETGRDAKAITAFKNLAFRAVAEASSELEGQNDVGILVDDTYGQSVLFESNRYPFWVGRSIEKTGVNPLMFEGKADVGSTLQAWPENHVVKCLFRPGAKDAPEVVEENERQLCRLFSGARSTGHDLLLEIIVDQPQTREEQDACLLRWMRRCYELGVYPDYWKILPVADQGTWQAIEALIGEYDPYCRGILFLGLNVAEAELVKRFAALPESPRALGFAIGRSIFLEPARKWFAGQMSDEDAVATMRDCFLRLARAWNGRNRG